MTIRKSATEPLVVNHLWPSMTHSSPSRTAVVAIMVGSAPAPGSVMENPLRMRPSSRGSSHLLRLLLPPGGLDPDGQQLGVARVGGVVAEDHRSVGGLAEDLVHEPQLDLAEATTPELGREVGGPQPPAP